MNFFLKKKIIAMARYGVMNKLFKLLITAFLLITMFSLIVMPMSAKQQYIFGIINILLLFIIGSKKSKKRLLTMIFLS